jgi:hydrogenase-4 component F
MILPILLLIPFAAGVFSALARTRRAMETANLAAFGLAFLVALAIAKRVLGAGSVSLWGGFLYADSLSALVCLLTASVSLVCAVYAVGYLREDERSGAFDDEETASTSKLRKYYTLTPLFVASMFLVALAGNLGVMWVAIEATTLASVFLVTFYGKATSLEAAWKYAMIGGVGLSMALFGTVLAYYAGHRLAGTDTIAGLNWPVLARHAAQLDRTTMRLAFIMALLGYGTKAGLAPMHTWKPDAYSEAPVPAAAILSTAMLNCALYGLIRFYILTSRSVGPDFPGRLLLVFGVLSMGISVPFVLVQTNFRRLLAYHTIDHAGIMAMALGVGGKLAALGLMLHMTYHTVAKSCAPATSTSVTRPTCSPRSRAASSTPCPPPAPCSSWLRSPSSACPHSACSKANFSSSELPSPRGIISPRRSSSCLGRASSPAPRCTSARWCWGRLRRNL